MTEARVNFNAEEARTMATHQNTLQAKLDHYVAKINRAANMGFYQTWLPSGEDEGLSVNEMKQIKELLLEAGYEITGEDYKGGLRVEW